MQYRQMLYHPEFECSSRLLHEGRIPGGYVVKGDTLMRITTKRPMARRVASLHADSQRHGDYEESGELVHTPRLCMSGVS